MNERLLEILNGFLLAVRININSYVRKSLLPASPPAPMILFFRRPTPSMKSPPTNDDEGGGGGTTTWLSAARDLLIHRSSSVTEHRLNLHPDDGILLDVLCAFDGGNATRDDNNDDDDDCDYYRDRERAPGPSNLDPNDGGSTSMEVLRDRISMDLLDEVDVDQARMFGRRFMSVSALLSRESDGVHHRRGDDDYDRDSMTRNLLRLALHRRAVQILSTSDPILSRRKALRVRSLIDFVWSQSLLMGPKDDDAKCRPTLMGLVNERDLRSSSSSYYDEFHPGFRHAVIDIRTRDYGPVYVNILRIDVDRREDDIGEAGTNTIGGSEIISTAPTPAVRMRCVDARDATTDLRQLAERTGAIAAISGGFFLYSEPDVELPSRRTDPVGMLVSDGCVIGPPVFRRAAIAQTCMGTGEAGTSSIRIGRVGMEGVTCSLLRSTRASSSSSASDDDVLDAFTIGKDGVRCAHRGSGEDAVDMDEADIAFSIVGRSVIAVHRMPMTRIRVPLAGFVLLVPGGFHRPEYDDGPIRVSYALPSPNDVVMDAIAGGPMLFSDDDVDVCDGHGTIDLMSEDFRGSAPPVTFSQDETHDHNLLPRMAVGIARCTLTGKKQLVVVAVDGRNLDRALGLTLRGTADLLRSLGCTTAMNLDGGSSKRMVLWDPRSRVHRVVCLSTTEIKACVGGGDGSGDGEEDGEPSRPVHSAILFLPGEL